jgi:hypothetical protein
MDKIIYTKEYKDEDNSNYFYLAFNGVYRVYYVGNFEDSIEVSFIGIDEILEEFDFEEFCKNEENLYCFDLLCRYDSDHYSYYEEDCYENSYNRYIKDYDFIDINNIKN